MTSTSMEQVFYATHSKLSQSILRLTSPSFRSLIEHLVLTLAVCVFCIVALSHATFVHGNSSISSSCFELIPGFRGDVDVTHIVTRFVPTTEGSTAFTVRQERGYERDGGRVVVVMGEGGCVVAADDRIGSMLEMGLLGHSRQHRQMKTTKCPKEIVSILSVHGYIPMKLQNTTELRTTNHSSQSITYSFSHSLGLLLLPPTALNVHNVSTQFVLVSAHDSSCFGEPFVRKIVFSLVGSDTVILNWILGFRRQGDGRINGRWASWSGGDVDRRIGHDDNDDGRIRYVYHWKTGREIDLDSFDTLDHTVFGGSVARGTLEYCNNPSSGEYLLALLRRFESQFTYNLLRFFAFKFRVLLSTLVIFFLTTSLVSFTFQETQDRMLEFTLQLQTRVRARMPLGGLIARHILENSVFVPIMVGMMFFLIEFYGGDKFLAFMVLSMVWICEVFSAISIRSVHGMHYFPRVFFLYFTLFHVYFFSCPIGFTYASLASTALFLFHAMIFFSNRYEFPALRAGLISPSMPRMRAGRWVDTVRVSEVDARGSSVSMTGQQPVYRRPVGPPVLPDLSGLSSPNATNSTAPATLDDTLRSEQYNGILPPLAGNLWRYVAAASSSLQSIRSMASLQSVTSLADLGGTNWLFGGIADGEDDDSYMAYVRDRRQSTLSMGSESM